MEVDEKESMNIEFVRELNLPNPLQAGRHKFISAASGLVRAHGAFYAVADDENHIVRIPEDKQIPCQAYPVFSDSLSVAPKERKKKKPDLEAITFLDSSEKFKHGALLVVPSGSEKNRVRGALLPFAAKDKLSSQSQEINFSDLYAKISQEIGPINIEGAIANKTGLKLFTRGNGKKNKNAIIDVEFGLHPVSLTLKKITLIDLGSEQGYPIAFTDATVTSKGEIWFVAVAEATDSSYDDGKLLGAFVGKLSSENKVESISKENFGRKPEGISIDEKEGTKRFYFVTDADDSNVPSQLLTGF